MRTLQDKAMLVKLTVSQWTARRYDKKVSDKVAADYGASRDSGRYNKVLVAEDAIKTISKLVSEARAYHYAMSLPWTDDGARVLPAALYTEYSAAMRDRKEAFERAVRSFVGAYPSLVEEARDRLNGMFEVGDYPAPSEIGGKYDYDIGVWPIPDAADFRVSVQAEDIDAIRRDIESRVQAAAAAASRDVWRRVYEAVNHMAEKVRDADAVFRDSLIGNIRDLVRLVPALNIADDPDLEAIRQEIESKLLGYTPKDLREYPYERAAAVRDADAILEKMRGYMNEDNS